MAGIVAGCNSDSEVVSLDNNYVNCAVTGFSLQRDDSVAYRLDSVYFAIDLVKAEIFNADSLPVGTDVSAILVKVSTESAKECNITYPVRNGDRDTTVNLIKSPNDSVNFSKGDVKLEIVSYNGLAKREYTVRLNVHREVPDTLTWDPETFRPLNPSLSDVTAQKTIEWRGAVYNFATDGKAVRMRWSETWEGNFSEASVSLPAGGRIETLTPAGDKLCCLTADGTLFYTADCLVWTRSDVRMHHVYGEYDGMAIGAVRDADGWKSVTYPSTTSKALPEGCPVSGTSQMVQFVSKWNVSPTAIVVGGRDAKGELTGEAWAYDGSSWGRLSSSPFLEVEDAVIFPYKTPKVDAASWRVTEESVLVMMTGRVLDKSGKMYMNGTAYVSPDFGITWRKAADTFQPSDDFPAVYGAQAYVIDQKISIDKPYPSAPARVTAPVTEWECPYIYIFGGVDFNGRLVDTYRRGVINRFAFRPVY